MEKDYSEIGLAAFLDYLGDKGLIKRATAQSRKIATIKVLSAIDDHEKLDLREIDREHVFNRFVNKLGNKFTPDSLNTYKSRFNSSLDDFLRYTENPAAFKPGGSQRAARRSNESVAVTKKSVAKGHTKKLEEETAFRQLPGDGTKITFPVPIRPGVVVLISGLPGDLTTDEARRIGAVVAALATT